MILLNLQAKMDATNFVQVLGHLSKMMVGSFEPDPSGMTKPTKLSQVDCIEQNKI
jgi:hypothetical protein